MYASHFRRLPVLLILMTAFLLLPGCAKQTTKSPQPNRAALLDSLARKHDVPGVVFAEIGDSGEPAVFASGLADLEKRTPMGPDMAFHVGSVTKTFTATAVLMLVDRGQVSLDDTVDKYVSGLPNGDRITVRNLLMMRSGLGDYHTTEAFGKILEENPLHVWTYAELAGMVEIEDDPDEYFAYRNINYVTLGAILEKVTGKTRAEFVAENICKPLGLAHTFVPDSADMPANAARGYVPSEDGPDDMSDVVHPSWGGAAGDMVSTARDIAVWLRALHNGTLLSPERHADMFTMRGAFLHGGFGGYGQGTLNLFGAIGHGGDYSGIYTAAMFEYQGNLMVVLVNGKKQAEGGDATDVFFDLAHALYPPEANPAWRDEQLDFTLAMARDRLEVPGLIAKIALADGTDWTGTTGLAKADNTAIAHIRDWTGTPMTDGLKFRIASVSKSITATAILQLADKGVLNLDDTLAKWLPDVAVSTKHKVTIRQLLNHTSGIPDFIRNPAFFNDNYAHPLKKRTLAERIAYGVPVKAPGSEWAYSNTGYILLGLIIETASGQSYGEYLEEHIFTPLGMTASSVPGLYDFDVPAPHANGYTFNFNQLSEEPDDMPEGGWLRDQTESNWQGLGYGNVIATPADLLTWLRALADGRLLTKESVKAMHEYVDTGDYGYGLGVEDHNGYIGHDGDLPGYHTGAYSKDGNAIIVLMNGDSFFGRGLQVVRSLGGVLGL